MAFDAADDSWRSRAVRKNVLERSVWMLLYWGRSQKDSDGYFWISGRIDDVLNVSGHRLGTAEVESALVTHPAVAEAAVVGRPDDLKGQAVVAFVTLKAGNKSGSELVAALRSG